MVEKCAKFKEFNILVRWKRSICCLREGYVVIKPPEESFGSFTAFIWGGLIQAKVQHGRHKNILGLQKFSFTSVYIVKGIKGFQTGSFGLIIQNGLATPMLT